MSRADLVIAGIGTAEGERLEIIMEIQRFLPEWEL
jgi:hypothetical protein